MRRKFDKPPIDQRIGQLADRQHGVVTRADLRALGISENAIDARAKNGRLWRIHRGVYAVGRPTLALRGRFIAAVLSCGPGAALSHVAAGVLQGVLRERGPRIDVTVPGSGGRRRRGVVVIHRGALPDHEVTVVEGIPVTSPARTFVDLADVLPRRPLERALDEAEYLRLDLSGLAPRPGRRGAALLRELLGRYRAGGTRTRSELEERLLSLCRRRRLPAPEVNATIAGFEADFVWRERRLVVETDGWRAHGTRGAFERDRRRDAELLAGGWRVLRVSYDRLQREPDWVAGRIEAALGG
jgi:very-short-patch-repair endonuclease